MAQIMTSQSAHGQLYVDASGGSFVFYAKATKKSSKLYDMKEAAKSW
jgi:hypothetical protein